MIESKVLDTIRTGTLVWSVIWPVQTLGVSSSNFNVTPRKTASGNSCRKLSTIQRLDQELRTYWASTLDWSVVWPDQTLGRWVAISFRHQGKQSLETRVKIWARSNSWIKSYGPRDLVLWSGRWCGRMRCRRRYGPMEPVLLSGWWSVPIRRWGFWIAIS